LGVRRVAKQISDYLWVLSLGGLAIFVPFSIAGANACITLGFLASLISLTDPEARERYRCVRRDPMLLGCILLVISALPWVFMHEDLHRALRDLKSYWLLLIYFLVAYNLVSDRLRRVVFWILFGSMSASSLVAIIQYAGGIEFLFVRIAPATYRPGSTLYNMTFAGILYQLITVNAAMLLGYRLLSTRTLALGGGIIAQVIALVLTLTRGAWLAVIAGLFAVPILLRRRFLFLVMVVVVMIAGVLALQNDVVRQRASTIVENIRTPTDKNISTRLVLWDISWQVFKKHPLFGVGMGDYTIEAERHLGDRRVVTTVDSHNIYLQLLATRGLVGFIPFVVFWIILFRVLFDCKRAAEASGHRFGRHFVVGVVAATVAVLIGAVSENNIDDSEVFICFMLLVGMARSFCISASNHRSD
jgi:O-antigen ligase